MIKDPFHRMIMAYLIKTNPEVRRLYFWLKDGKAMNMRPDYMLIRVKDAYERVPDFMAWNFSMGGIHACLICKHGEWSVHS